MEAGFFTTVFVQPLYNGLVFLIDYLPGADAGIAIILFTFLVRLILYPLSRKSIQTQIKMKLYDGDIERIKNENKDNKQKQAEEIMKFWREKGLNPLSGFMLILLQIPIIFALYRIFLKSGLPAINESWLYTFVAVPQTVSIMFLGIIDITAKSFFLALLCGITQYFQIKLAMPAIKPKSANPSFKDDLARSMSLQMKYIFPIIAFFISYSLASTIALYWTTSNLFAIGQELYVRKKMGIGKI